MYAVVFGRSTGLISRMASENEKNKEGACVFWGGNINGDVWGMCNA